MRRILAAAALALLPGAASAVECSRVTHDGAGYTICETDPARDDLRLFHTGPDGAVYGTFSRIEEAVAPRRLSFAMNAGMYHDDRSPVGHYVENGVERMRVIPNAGPGNFGMLPNGVLCIRPGRADVIETLRYLDESPRCEHATQSGPMLVIDGALHPRFLPDSTSRFVRNGVGTSEDGRRAVFAISDAPVSFHQFARLFRDGLGLPNALYLDGRVSRLHAPALGRSDGGLPMGPVVGVLAD